MNVHKNKVSIIIPTYNMQEYLFETLCSCLTQSYKDIEIILYDDCSTDGTYKIGWKLLDKRIKYYRGKVNKGVGEAFNEGIQKANGEFIVLMCADDVFTNDYVISDYVNSFKNHPYVGHITRKYFQFIDGDTKKKPVRAWRTNHYLILANNPSGLAFRSDIVKRHKCSNKMFIETTQLVHDVVAEGCGVLVIPWDTVAARVHRSTSATPGYWLKRRVSSPVMDWYRLGAKEITKDYVSLIQIKNSFKVSAVFEEIYNFIKLRPLNLLDPAFYVFSLIAIFTPRCVLRRLPDLYRRYIGIRITKEIKRPC